jgi:alpha-N-arabinofuranosidase
LILLLERKPIKHTLLFPVLVGMGIATASASEFHVSVNGDDANDGSPQKPYGTISAAARIARPGDVITVHKGVYRERISPPRGGESDRKRIVYQAAPGEKVEIKGSEVVKNWVKVPYSDLIHGDWFNPKGRKHHTGAVYLNGEWLAEAARLAEVLQPAATTPLWFAEVDKENTTIWAQFKGVNPREQLVEINVRRTVFYPEKTGIDYITVRGFTMQDAATPWAPPTAGQIGLIGTHWSKGWIIESNVISYSTCSGIALGKYGDQWDNTSADTAGGYVKTIERALANGWSRENIGHHVVRNNTISHCEQAGIVGSLGAVFSTVTGNTIHDIHVRGLFSGAEMAGIKLHAAIDVNISRNHVYRTCRGLWLDWMAQGARVSENLFHDNAGEDVFVEVDHGPFLMDNNLFLSPVSLTSRSQGGAYVHNLFAGAINTIPFDGRQTPFLKAHSTELAGFHDNPRGDDRYYNNLFVGRGDLSQYDDAPLPVRMDGNVFLQGARPSKYETGPLVKPEFAPALKLVGEAGGCRLEMKYDPAWNTGRTRQIVTTRLLGRAIIPNAAYEQPDGAPIRINTDYFGKPRNEANPSAGPFENPGTDAIHLTVWTASKTE